MKTIIDRWTENMVKRAGQLHDDKQEELASNMSAIRATVNKVKSGRQSVRDKIKMCGDQILYKRGMFESRGRVLKSDI